MAAQAEVAAEEASLAELSDRCRIADERLEASNEALSSSTSAATNKAAEVSGLVGRVQRGEMTIEDAERAVDAVFAALPDDDAASSRRAGAPPVPNVADGGSSTGTETPKSEGSSAQSSRPWSPRRGEQVFVCLHPS